MSTEPEQILELQPPTCPTLWEVASPVLDPKFVKREWVERMFQIIRTAENPGCGLSAPQVDIGLRFFITEFPGMRVVINPRVVAATGARISKSEGCLTWKGKRTFMLRHENVLLEWMDRNGDRRTKQLSGFAARAVQHEIDHLDGKCIFPRA